MLRINDECPALNGTSLSFSPRLRNIGEERAEKTEIVKKEKSEKLSSGPDMGGHTDEFTAAVVTRTRSSQSSSMAGEGFMKPHSSPSSYRQLNITRRETHPTHCSRPYLNSVGYKMKK